MATAITQVGSASNNTGASTSLSAVTVTRTVTAGNTVVVTIAIHTVGTTVTSITDTGGSAYTRRATVTQGGFITQEIWSTAAGGALGCTSITVTVSAVGIFIADVGEYNGVALLGSTNTNSSASGQPSVSITTQDANNFTVMGFAIDGTPSTSALTGTVRQNHQTSAVGGNITGGMVDNTRQTVGALVCAVSPSAVHYAACSLELRSVNPGSLQVPTVLTTGAFAGTAGCTIASLALATGNLLVVCMDWDSSRTVSAITWNGIALTLDDVSAPLGALQNAMYSLSIASGATANLVVTLSGTARGVVIPIKCPGAATASWTDQVSDNNQGSAGTTPTTGNSPTTTQANELIIVSIGRAGSTIGGTWASGAIADLTTVADSTNVGLNVGYQIVNQTGVWVGSKTGSTSSTYCNVIATYKGVSAAAALPPAAFFIGQAVRRASYY